MCFCGSPARTGGHCRCGEHQPQMKYCFERKKEILPYPEMSLLERRCGLCFNVGTLRRAIQPRQDSAQSALYMLQEARRETSVRPSLKKPPTQTGATHVETNVVYWNKFLLCLCFFIKLHSRRRRACDQALRTHCL